MSMTVLSAKTIRDVSSSVITGAGGSSDGVIALQYPMSMNSQSEEWKGAPVLMFTIFEQNAISYGKLVTSSAKMASSGISENARAVLMLPMPSNGLTDNVTNNIGAGDNSFLQELIGNGFAAAQSGKGFMDTVQKTGQALFSTVKTEAVVNLNKASKAYNTQRGAGQTIAGNRGFHAFNGTEPRTFTFNWRFVPKNLAELKTISNIIQVLKEASVSDPMGDPNGYIVSKAPLLVSCQEHVLGAGELSKIRYTPRFGTGVCQIAGFRVTTGQDGLYGTIEGTAGDPNVYDVELQIKELLQPTSSMYRELANHGSFMTSEITPKRVSDKFSNYAGEVKAVMK